MTIATFPSNLPMMVPFCVRVLPLPVAAEMPVPGLSMEDLWYVIDFVS